MKRKVFFIGPVPPPVGGVSNHIVRMMSKISITDDIECAVLDIGRMKFFDQNLVRKNIFYAMTYFLSADIIHLHINHKWKVGIGIISKVFNKKLIYTRHNLHTSDLKSATLLHKMADAAIFVSTPSFDTIDQKTKLIPAFISSEKISELNVQLKAVLNKYKTIIAAISTHPAKKPALLNGKDLYGFDMLLEAYENLIIENALLILLDPACAMKNVYKSKVESLNNSGKDVMYLTDNIDFSALTKYLTLYVRPTLMDGDSLAIRESLEAGVKVIASDSVKRPDGVQLFKINDVNSLLENLQKLINAPIIPPQRQPDFSVQILDLYRNFF